MEGAARANKVGLGAHIQNNLVSLPYGIGD